MTKFIIRVLLPTLLCAIGVSCDTQDPPVAPTPSSSAPVSPDVSAAGSGDPLLLDQGSAEGIDWKLVLKPGDPVCAELRAVAAEAGTIVCDSASEQDFNGDERMRYAFTTLGDEEGPKFVIGVTDPAVAKVVVNAPSGKAPEAATRSSPAASGRRFFAVYLSPVEPELASEFQAIRGLDQTGKTVAGFRFGPMDEPPEPLVNT